MKKMFLVLAALAVIPFTSTLAMADGCRVRGDVLELYGNFGPGVMKASIGTYYGGRSFQSGVIQCEGGPRQFRELRRSPREIELEVRGGGRFRRVECRVDVNMNWHNQTFFCR